MSRADTRNAILKHRVDARSRAMALRTPPRFTKMKPWWQLQAERVAQEEERERAQRPVILPIQKTATIPGMLATALSKATAYRPAFLGAAHA